ncbi:MAG: class II aldolase/adducin family protein, partial [Microbacterium sp.]
AFDRDINTGLTQEKDMGFPPINTRREDEDDACWQMRVDLAAVHRLAVQNGYNSGIFNHFTARVPGTDDRYYQIPFGTHWAEVQASHFMEVGYDGTIHKGTGDAELSCICIHGPMHRLADHAAVVLHTHMPHASALTRLADQHILPIGQTELGTISQIAYDESYGGFAYDPAEGERLTNVLGSRNVLMMANHGVTVVGRTVAEAWDRLYYLERSAQVQLYAMWTGKPLRILPDEMVQATMEAYKQPPKMYGGKKNSEHHFAALKRLLDKSEPDYRD